MKPLLATFVLAAALLDTAILSAGEKSYPRAELLVEPAALKEAKHFVILDARARKKYGQGHIPGAFWVDHEAWAKAFDHGQNADDWSKRIGELGIEAKSKVVVYDDNFSKDAARIWWILRYWGLEDVRLLNGGWKGWQDAKYPVDQTEHTPAAVKFTAKPGGPRLATKDQLLRSLADGKLQIVDARSEKEFCGDEKMSNKRAGAIPGARHLEWIDLIDKETQCFKSPDDLRRLFKDAGIVLDQPTATYCQSGGRASVMAFGLELMGSRDVSNYYPSWAEWSGASDTPVEPGKAKKNK
jgi:thiosulfate/3-mercaptopyruvate sulfurtransferase